MQTSHGPSLTALLERFPASEPGRREAPARAERSPARYGFRVGSLGLVVEPLTLMEVVLHRSVTPLPGGPAWLSGIMNVRGNPVPVFDLRRALPLSDPPAASPGVLVLDAGAQALGIAIDSFPQPLRALRRTAHPSELPTRLEPFLRACWLDEDSVWIEFDHRGLFAALCGNRPSLPN